MKLIPARIPDKLLFVHPSEKYGYIIPESGENVSRVKEFKEKPDVETAKKYLAQSALWNAGIFAFKLGYLLDKAHSMIDFEDYRDLFNKYETLTKISFDYAVVEKESSIQVLRYSGDWKDVGTWNMMAEVMADKTKGKAILDETCENTNVVNTPPPIASTMYSIFFFSAIGLLPPNTPLSTHLTLE